MLFKQKLLLAMIGSALFTFSVETYAETENTFEKVLPIAKKHFTKKDEFETLNTYLARLNIDCKSTSSLLCAPLFIENPIYTEYDPETEELKYHRLYDNDLIANVGYWQPPFEQKYCADYKVLSRVEKHQVLQNAFGATRAGVTASIRAIGVVFVRSETAYTPGTQLTYKTCTDEKSNRSSNWRISHFDQAIKVSRQDARTEKGKFLIRLSGIPISPYYTSVGSDTGQDFSQVNRTIISMEAVIISPIHWKIIGKETRKVYAEGNFPIAEVQ